jgi:hypothetical protein
LYNEVRKKYGCNQAFPTLYKKIKPEVNVIAIGERVAQELGAGKSGDVKELRRSPKLVQ